MVAERVLQFYSRIVLGNARCDSFFSHIGTGKLGLKAFLFARGPFQFYELTPPAASNGIIHGASSIIEWNWIAMNRSWFMQPQSTWMGLLIHEICHFKGVQLAYDLRLGLQSHAMAHMASTICAGDGFDSYEEQVMGEVITAYRSCGNCSNPQWPGC
ncbi:MAG: hypothetical protein JRH20_20215 [Deltaproteobacteria bacterium]|nr:hypothetical protein [Deltaproteobacteria bacterium]